MPRRGTGAVAAVFLAATLLGAPAWAAESQALPSRQVAGADNVQDKLAFARDVENLLTLLDVGTDLRFICDGVRKNIEKGKILGAIPKSSWPNLPDALQRVFTVDRYKGFLRRDYLAGIDPALLPELRAWFGGELGKKAIAAKDAVLTPVGEEALRAYRDNPQSAPPTARRMAQLRRMDEVIRATASEDAILLDMQKIYSDGFAFYNLSPDENVKKTAEYIADNRAKTQQRNLLGLAYIYRDFSDQDLDAVIAFYAGHAGQNLIDVSTKSERTIWMDINRNYLLLRMGQVIGSVETP